MPDKFRKAIRQIMSDDGQDSSMRLDERPADPESHGWLRKPEWDRGEGEAWELPDGAVRLVRRVGVAGIPVGRGPES